MKLPASPAFYANLYPVLVLVAREYGYALALHGTLTRDMDLIAVPWTAEAKPAKDLVDALKTASGGVYHTFDAHTEATIRSGYPANKPHGRKAWSIHFTREGGDGMYVDVSVMPLQLQP